MPELIHLADSNSNQSVGSDDLIPMPNDLQVLVPEYAVHSAAYYALNLFCFRFYYSNLYCLALYYLIICIYLWYLILIWYIFRRLKKIEHHQAMKGRGSVKTTCQTYMTTIVEIVVCDVEILNEVLILCVFLSGLFQWMALCIRSILPYPTLFT